MSLIFFSFWNTTRIYSSMYLSLKQCMMTLFHFHVHMILVYMTLKVSPFTLKNFLNHRLVRKTWCQQVHSSMSHHVHCLLGEKRLIWYPKKINKFIAGKYGQLDSLSAILFCMIPWDFFFCSQNFLCKWFLQVLERINNQHGPKAKKLCLHRTLTGPW